MRRLILILSCTLLFFGSCNSPGAVEGASRGAFYGAVSSGVVAAVFGGDVGDSMARGAVAGGTIGGLHGLSADSSQKARQKEAAEIQAAAARTAEEIEANAEELRDKLIHLVGPDNTRGVEELVQCRHEEAKVSARKASVSNDRDYKLAALWLKAMIALDERDVKGARAIYPTIVAQDDRIATEEDAEKKALDLVTKLEDTRAEFGLPRRCE
jgi:hypothetical protein